MTKKQAIIKGITYMNISMLEILLEDDRAYSDVSKEVFIQKLSQTFNNLKIKGGDHFINVERGHCGDCFKDCGGYTFSTKHDQYLDIFFVEENEEIIDIRFCYDFINDEELEKGQCYNLSFYEEEKVDFNPSTELKLKIKKIKEWERSFTQFKNTITSLEIFSQWYEKKKSLRESFDVIDNIKYKFLNDDISQSVELSCVYELVEKHSLAIIALREFKRFDLSDEKALINWLLNYENDNLSYAYGYEKINNWKQNNLIHLTSDTTVVLDCANYKESLEFEEVYDDYYSIIVDKYSPTDEHYNKGWESKGSLIYQYLKLHGVHVDITEKYEKKLETEIE